MMSTYAKPFFDLVQMIMIGFQKDGTIWFEVVGTEYTNRFDNIQTIMSSI